MNSLSLDIYHTYDVFIVSDNSHYSEDSYPGDVDIISNNSEEHFTVDGGELISMFARWFTDEDISEIYFKSHCIQISFFNPLTGLSDDISVTWKESNNL